MTEQQTQPQPASQPAQATPSPAPQPALKLMPATPEAPPAAEPVTQCYLVVSTTDAQGKAETRALPTERLLVYLRGCPEPAAVYYPAAAELVDVWQKAKPKGWLVEIPGMGAVEARDVVGIFVDVDYSLEQVGFGDAGANEDDDEDEDDGGLVSAPGHTGFRR